MKILLIDDNLSITKALSRLLTLKGHECVISNDGRNGLTMILNKKFDIVFLDIAMPDFSGKHVLDELSKQNKISSQAIIILTASAISESDIEGFNKLGVFTCLKKPISSSLLYDTLEEIQNKQTPIG